MNEETIMRVIDKGEQQSFIDIVSRRKREEKPKLKTYTNLSLQ
jgi:hypothetical protein